MATHRTTVLAGLALLLAALLCGPGLAFATAEGAPVGDGSGFGAPESAQLSAARELPERLHATTVAGSLKPALAPLPQIALTVAPAAVAADGTAPLFLVHCAFLC